MFDLLSRRSEPILLLVHGDAEEIVSQDVDALHDRTAAATGVSERHPSPRTAVVEPHDDAPKSNEGVLGLGPPMPDPDPPDHRTAQQAARIRLYPLTMHLGISIVRA